MNRVLSLVAMFVLMIAFIVYDDGEDETVVTIPLGSEEYIGRAGLCALYYQYNNQPKSSDLATLEASWWVAKNKGAPLDISKLNEIAINEVRSLTNASRHPRASSKDATLQLITKYRCQEIVKAGKQKVRKSEGLLDIVLED